MGFALTNTLLTIVYQEVQSESSVHRDILWLDIADENCAAKTFAWWLQASWRFPAARWLVKADDDSYLQVLPHPTSPTHPTPSHPIRPHQESR